jgi:hypothetical protein
MALTVSSIEADFIKDTKTIGKQSAYLEFHFGDRVHTTDVLKSTGKFATWETPVQLTGAGITMKIIAKASKSLAKDKPLGTGELNMVQAAGQGPQTVLLHDKLTGSSAGEVRLTVSGGSPAISGLPHTEGHGTHGGVAGMMPGHHGQQGTEQGYGTGGVGTTGGMGGAGQQGYGEQGMSQQSIGQQGYGGEHQGHGGALGGAAAGAGAAGLGAAAMHHHNQQGQNTGMTGQNTGMTGQNMGQHESLAQRVEEKLPGSTAYGSNQGGMGGGMVGGAPRQHETMGQRVEEHLPGHHNQQGGMGGGMVGGAPRQHETMGQRVQEHMPGHHNQQGVGGYNQTGQTGVMHPMGGAGNTGTGMGMGGSNTGMGNTGMGSGGMGSGMGGSGMGGNNPDMCGSCAGAGGTCPQCGGTGSLAQRMEQGMGLGGGRHQQQGAY